MESRARTPGVIALGRAPRHGPATSLAARGGAGNVARVKIPPGALVRDLTLPELGYGRVLSTARDGTSAIAYAGDEALREVRLDDQRDVVRARLHAGQRARVGAAEPLVSPRGAGGPEGRIVRPLPPPRDWEPGDPEPTWRYLVLVEGKEREVDERALAPCEAASDDPFERLEALS